MPLYPAPEERLLASLRAVSAPPPADELGALFETAARHGLAELACEAWRVQAIPMPEAVEAARSERRACDRLAAVASTQALTACLDALTNAGMVAVPLKGVSLSLRLYGDPAIRPGADVDLLVAPEDEERAARALESIGYTRHARPKRDGELGHELPFTKDGAPLVELHRRPSSLMPETATAVLLQRLQPPTPASRWPTLDGDDEAVTLIAHAAGHAFGRLAWLLEIAEWLTTRDLDAVAFRAEELGVGTAWRLTAEVAWRYGWLPRHPSPTMRTRCLLVLLAATRHSPPGSAAGTATHILYRALLADRWLDGLGFLVGALARLLRHRWRLAGARSPRHLAAEP